MASESSIARPASKPLVQGPMLYVAGAFVVVGIALFGYLQYSSNQKPADIPLTPEAKAYVHNLKLDDVEMKATESYLKQTVVEIQGTIGNAGDRNLQTVEIYCIFKDAYGQLVLRKRVPIVNGGLKPGETKSFRLPFDEIPESWNQALPQLVIAGVKFS